ncbi:tetratricopeptide repeat-containing sensor histidine kinase [Carboxylicivirga sediminis]|uniref:histidine kinase n=1 Tax=Carboxylicivirga sediminis TaxID=2006564 RepID=A0A941IZJ8_9BACT|nr:tetratricopeptide repeat protein [Carboxylicivirga sediminis]MBR8537523.1 tetratricopeptide repeat-containing sensor histidine kinase [Carboxylicivirga sediminis]
MTTKLLFKSLYTITGCILLFLNCSFTAHSQQNKETAFQYIEQAEKAQAEDEVISLCQQSVSVIANEPNPSVKFDVYHKAGLALFNHKQYNIAREYLNNALTYKAASTDKNNVGITEEYLGWIENANNQNELAIEHFNRAKDIFTSTNNLEKLGNTYNSLGAMYWYLRNYAQALEYFDMVLTVGEKIDNTVLIRKGLTNKGVVLNTLAQYNEALICLERALELNQLDSDAKSRAVLLNNIGNINGALNNNEAAIRNYQEALAIYSQLDDKDGISSCYNNLGEVHLELGNILQAIENYQTSLNILIQEGDSSKIAVSYVNIGRAHQNGEQYSKAISYFEKALKLMLTFNDPSLKAETYLHLGQTLLTNKHYQQASDYLTKATKLAKELDEKALLADCYNSMSAWHSQQANYKDALDYKTKYAELKDAITDEQAMLSSARMEAVYKLLNKEEQISKLEQDNLNKSASLATVRTGRTTYLIITGFLLMVVVVLFLSFRSRRKTERLLKEKNNELQQLNATKDKFFSIIAHDLKSPFSSLMGFAEMLTLNAESKNTKEVVEYSQIIHNSTKRLLGLVENLLQWSRTQLGTTEYKPTQLDISIQTHNIVSLLRLNAEEKDIVISPRIERNLVAWADENLYNTILRNLISNAIKFSRIGSVIYVAASAKNDMIEVSVADSGVGIRQENLEKLFMVDSTFSTKGTLNEKGTGLGLVLCKEFVEINKGAIWAESELEKGSTFYFTLPLLQIKNN